MTEPLMKRPWTTEVETAIAATILRIDAILSFGSRSIALATIDRELGAVEQKQLGGKRSRWQRGATSFIRGAAAAAELWSRP